MKFVYVCSPLRGDIEKNIEKAHEYNSYVIDCGFMPLAPHVIFSKYFNDNIPERRELGLAMGLELLKRCDEIWVCGDTISQGMQGEINLARHMKIPTLYVDDALLLSQTPIRQEQAPLSSDDVIENSLNGVLRNKILVLNPDSVHGGSSDRSLWKCVDDKSVVGGYIDWLQMENLIGGEKRSIWINEFLGVVKPESLSNWLANNPVHGLPTRDDLNEKIEREAKKVFDVATEDDLASFYSEVEIKYQIRKELQNIFMSDKMVQTLMLKDNVLDEAYRFYLAENRRDQVFLAVFDYLEKEEQGQFDTSDIDYSVGNDDEELEP